eukprot:scaffold1305_cov112-Cylindrotheca_fusiformis.AAC.3
MELKFAACTRKIPSVLHENLQWPHMSNRQLPAGPGNGSDIGRKEYETLSLKSNANSCLLRSSIADR